MQSVVARNVLGELQGTSNSPRPTGLIHRFAALEQVDRREWAFVLLVTVALLVLTSLPYVYGYLSAPPNKVFMGVMLGVPDHEQYFSWMRELSTANLAANKLTPEANSPVFFNLLWWVMGHVGALLGLGFGPMYQILRVVATGAFFAAVFAVIRRFMADSFERRVAFLVVALSSGLGWVLVVSKYSLTPGQLLFPIDVFIAEGNTFLDVMAYPHFVAAGLYVLVFELVLIGLKRRSLVYSWGAGLLAFVLGWAHAYDLILVYGVLGLFILALGWRDRAVPRFMISSLAIIGLVSVWPALYSVLLTRLDPIWREVLAQFSNAGVYSPNPFHLLIVMGIPLMLALAGLLTSKPLRLRGITDERVFLRVWFVANLFLLYIPTDYQVHMLNGLQVPTAILATGFLFSYGVPRIDPLIGLFRRIVSRLTGKQLLAAILIAAVVPTNLYLWSWRFVDLSRHDYPYYLHVDEVAALGWLDSHVRGDDVVLSSLTFGQFVPAYTGAHAFLGHWAQTVDFYGKEQMVARFYSGASTDAYRLQLLKSFGVDYIVDGYSEHQLGSFDPARAPFLSLVYSSGAVSIYRFDAPSSGQPLTKGEPTS